MLQIYHAPGTRGIRVIWLCEELGIEYEVTKIDFSPKFRSSPDWRKKSPLGKVPVMTDGDMIMFESGAMVQYILDRYDQGGLVPAVDSAQYGPYLQWMWFSEATLLRPLGEIVSHGRAFPGDARIPEVVAEMGARGAACLQAVAEAVQSQDYLLGDQFSAADIMMGYAIMVSEMLIPDLIPESLKPYWQRLSERPALQKARAA